MPLILIPYFGEVEKFRPLLDRWFSNARAAMPNAIPTETFVLLTDSAASCADASKQHECGVCACDVLPFREVIREGQPFDVKGALVCSFLLQYPYPVMVLDADAFLAKDPFPLISSKFRNAPLAMPKDHGALIYGRRPMMDEPFTDVLKLCAGVQWFGAGGDRVALVAGYVRAFGEIMALAPRVPWTPQLHHLAEQYAWSIAAHRHSGEVLPGSMNWNADHLGENPNAIVNHHYGHPKWKDLPKPDALTRRVL